MLVRRQFSVTVVAFVTTVALACAWAPSASAHASLSDTEPAPRASVEVMPSEVSATFSENIGPSFLAVTAPDGSSVEMGEVAAVGRTVSASIHQDPGLKGTYTVAYRVVSADSHPVDGTFTFTVTTGNEAATASEAPADSQQASFIHRHRGHLIWGMLAGLIAIALMLAPLRRRATDQ